MSTTSRSSIIYRSFLAPHQRGVTLIELIVFIVIVSTALTGILLVINRITGNSADPQVQKQALAIAEALLEEIESQPFTFCDPEDANASTATSASVSASGCATTVETATQHTTDLEHRTSDPRFDNVIDYNEYSMTGVEDLTGTALGLGTFTASVAVATDGGLGATGAPISSSEVLLITVTVSGPGIRDVVLSGYRTRYAPRT